LVSEDKKDYTQYTCTFNVSDNAGGNIRRAYAHVLNGDVSLAVVLLRQGGSIIHENTSNAYILKPGGEIYIPVSRVYEHAQLMNGGAPGSGDVFEPSLLWEDVSGLLTVWPDEIYVGGAIRVIAAPGKTGNAVVAVKKDGAIVWSWHIWVTDYDPDNRGATWQNPYEKRNYIFMDRNLGATAAELSLAGRGLFYQWGRKDPFPGGKEGTAGYAALSKFKGMPDAGSTNSNSYAENATDAATGIQLSIENPTTFYVGYITGNWLKTRRDDLWNADGNKKSIYDPCPGGWRVPLSGGKDDDTFLWYGLPIRSFFKTDSSGVDWSNPSDTGNGLYPGGGCREPNYGGFNSTDHGVMYWSASAVSDKEAYALKFYDDGELQTDRLYYAYGASVRCVRVL
jgi:hypothetical protein